MGGLQHETIQTGELIDFLMDSKPNSCFRDVQDKNNFTVIALKAATFTYSFHNEKGASVDLHASRGARTLSDRRECFRFANEGRKGGG